MSTKSQSHPAQIPEQQTLLGLDIIRLKGIENVSLDFNLSPLTAIMGGNGCGKTTVLHAIACGFEPLNSNDPNYKFPLFFRPNTDALWKESDFTIRYSERIGENSRPNLSQNYKKLSDRWTPRYLRRPKRYTRFVSIGESVPDIEMVNLTSMIHYTKTENIDKIGQDIREIGGQILNRVYDSLYTVKYTYRDKHSIGVKVPGLIYSGLSMSSGEQRVFRILEAVLRAPKYGLILIDEIDLFLHQDALQRLLNILRNHCHNTHKQLIFTTHFPPVAEMYDKMAIYSLNRISNRTIIWRGYSYEAMRHITGTQERPILCCVEDEVAEHIVGCVAAHVGIRKFVKFIRYGPAQNAFSLCAGLYLADKHEHTLAVLDGDVYRRRKEREDRIKTTITGTLLIHDKQRTSVMRLIGKLNPSNKVYDKPVSPEQVLHHMLHGLKTETIPPDRADLHQIALSIVNVPEKHEFIKLIISHTGESREVALSKIIELASLSTEWNNYTRIVRKWLTKQKSILNL